MGGRDENRWWADERAAREVLRLGPARPAGTGASSTSTTSPRCAEDPEVFDVDPRQGPRARARRRPRRAARRPPRRAGRPGGLPAPAARARRRARLGREDPRTPASPCATGRSRARSATSSSTTPRRCSSTRRPRTTLTDALRELTGETRRFAEVALDAQVEQATTTFAREVARLRDALVPTRRALARRAGRAAGLPHLRRAVDGPRRGRGPRGDRGRRHRRAGWRARCCSRSRGHDEFVTRFQQTSPPVTAKGVEDTAFYRYLRLLALNEVGGDPARFGISVEAFHAAQRRARARASRAGCWSRRRTTRSAAATCARRIGALAVDAGEWARARAPLARADRGAAARRRARRRRGATSSSRRSSGAWPISRRAAGGLPREGAARGASVTTNWVDQDHDWEARVKAFAPRAADHRAVPGRLRRRSPRGWPRRGARSALAQLLLKLTVARASPTSTRATSSRR